MNIAVYKSNASGVIIPIWHAGSRWQYLGGSDGAGFLFENCLADTTRSRGFLLKASDGQIKNCTIRNVGMAAILVKPEIDEV